MKIWQFKVASGVWLKNGENEYINLKVGNSFLQKATLSKKLNNCIGEIVVYYNSKEIKSKKLYRGIYLVCKIISNVYEKGYENWIEMEVIFDYRENPYLYDSDFPELHQYHNTLEVRNRSQTYEYIDDEKCNIEMFYNKIMEYGSLLAIEEDSLLNDIKKIEYSKDLTATEKKSLVKCRLGQGIFRKELIAYWKGCSVTGLKQKDILIASHIKPWKDSNNKEKLDIYNGLLLTPNLDKLFDRGYISFDENGCIIFSNHLSNIGNLFINRNMQIKIKNKHKKYLKFHRDNILKK